MTEEKHYKYPLVRGKRIRFRREQQLGWTAWSVILGTCFIAGLYWIGLQQRYHLGPLNVSAKNWWDSGMGFIHSGNWGGGKYPERHAIRNLGEPAAWTMIGATILGKAKVDQRMLSTKWLIIAPLLLLGMLVAGATAISLVLAKIPAQWEKYSLLSIALGMILGRLLHFAWAPIGGTIRHKIVLHSVEAGGTPLWVTFGTLPPAWRELWSELGGGSESAVAGKRHHHIGLIMLILLVFLFVAVVGGAAKYGAPHGHLLPGMTT